MSGLPGPSGPADLAPARWFHLEGEVRRGPVALDEVREHVLDGSIGPETWVWSDGMDDWMRVRDVPALVPPAALRATLRARAAEGTRRDAGRRSGWCCVRHRRGSSC